MDNSRIIIFISIFLGSNGIWAETAWDGPLPPAEAPLEITVYRSPTCTCCGIWLDHLRTHQFEVTDIKTTDMQAVKQKHGVPVKLASCHTGIIGGYVVEGHVPAADIRKVLQENPVVTGVSVPGMPHGTPGMEMSGRKEPFSVISFDKEGKTKKFSEYLFY